MRSGELAIMAAVNKETLRFYERKGLLRKPERSEGGYRAYNDDDLQRLLFIKNAQQFGFDLEQIGELIAIADGKIVDRVRVREIAKRRVTQVELQIEALDKLRTVMKQLIHRCSHSGATHKCPIIESLSGHLSTKNRVRKNSNE